MTQVLDESAPQGYGTNTYTYGLGRISQKHGSTAEYFLGDALGSVRQLTRGDGGITLAKSYDPYGEVTSTSGTSQSAYGYTGEQQDASGLTYLRARYYNVNDGRFQSRDTWQGNENLPESYNLWNYDQSNPVNYTDPTGNFGCGPSINERANFAASYVSPKRLDPLNTYTAAGIGVQCWGWDNPLSNDPYQGRGIAQITDRQKEEEYGKKVYHVDKNGDPDVFDNKGKPIVLGYGLRCWIRIAEGCTVCKTHDELKSELKAGQKFEDIYKLEDVHDQSKETAWAVEYMRRRIEQVINNCLDCTETDKFIAAALGQNGPGLNPGAMKTLSTWGVLNPFRQMRGGPINWEAYFEDRINKGNNILYNRGRFDTSHQLDLFFGIATNLNQRSFTEWYLPVRLDTKRIKALAGM